MNAAALTQHAKIARSPHITGNVQDLKERGPRTKKKLAAISFTTPFFPLKEFPEDLQSRLPQGSLLKKNVERLFVETR